MLMRVDASASGDQSVSRRLGDHFEQQWGGRTGSVQTSIFDLTQEPPPLMSASFISAAYTAADQLDDLGRAVLAYSDYALGELSRADVLLITTPIYNFGIPAALKAWFDQIIRIGVSFGTTSNPEQPYVPLLPNRPVIVVTARGSADMVESGALANLDFLTPHLRTMLGFIGFSNPTFFDICGTEASPLVWEQDLERLQVALEQAAKGCEGMIKS